MSGRWIMSRRYSSCKARYASGLAASSVSARASLEVPEPVLPLALGQRGEHALQAVLPGSGTHLLGQGGRIDRQESARPPGHGPGVVEPEHDILASGRLPLAVQVVAGLEDRPQRGVAQRGDGDPRDQVGRPRRAR